MNFGKGRLNCQGTADLLWKCVGWQVTQSGGAENTFSQLLFIIFEKVGWGLLKAPSPSPSASPAALPWEFFEKGQRPDVF